MLMTTEAYYAACSFNTKFMHWLLNLPTTPSKCY